MRTFKNLLFLTFIAALTYSCEPEELPETTPLTHEKVLAGTGDQGDEVVDRKGNSTD